jgi:hypothetical protein
MQHTRQKRSRYVHFYIQQNDRWEEAPYLLSRRICPPTAEEMARCATCDAPHPSRVGCMPISSPDLASNAFEHHVFGICDACQQHYTTEEICQIVQAAKGRPDASGAGTR